MTAEELYEILRKQQESRGFYFNKNQARVLQLLEGLLTNKARYGYMSCPCRLSANDRSGTGTSSAPAFTGNRTWRNMVLLL